jgi:hypothetical protein
MIVKSLTLQSLEDWLEIEREFDLNPAPGRRAHAGHPRGQRGNRRRDFANYLVTFSLFADSRSLKADYIYNILVTKSDRPSDSDYRHIASSDQAADPSLAQTRHAAAVSRTVSRTAAVRCRLARTAERGGGRRRRRRPSRVGQDLRCRLQPLCRDRPPPGHWAEEVLAFDGAGASAKDASEPALPHAQNQHQLRPVGFGGEGGTAPTVP